MVAQDRPLARLPDPRGVSANSTVVAVDVGGTTIKAARVDRDGRTHASVTLPTGKGDEAVEKVMSVLDQLRDETTVAATVAVPGIVDHHAGVVRQSVNLDWHELPLAQLVGAEVGVPTSVVHDVRAAASAELAIGRGRNVSNMLIVVIGTGLSAGIVVNGQQLTGATYSAGEIGHMIVVPGGEACACGQLGCVEVYASAGGILRRYEALGGDPSLSVARISASPDKIAERVWGDAMMTLGRAMASATVVLDPELIVIAGGLSLAGAALETPLRVQIAANLAWRSAPTVALSALTSRAGLVGAAIEAWRISGQPDIAAGWSSALTLTTLQG